MFAVRKSKRSNTVLSNNVYVFQILNENTVPRPTNQVIEPQIMLALIRAIPRLSTSHATAGSINEIDDVHAANTNSTKNSVPNITPPGICPNANGKVLNIKPGPCAASS